MASTNQDSMEYRIFSKEYNNIHTVVRNVLGYVVQEAYSKRLIPEERRNVINNPNSTLSDDVKARMLLDAVKDCIKVKPSALWDFVEILRYEPFTEVLVEKFSEERIQEELDIMKKEREEAAKKTPPSSRARTQELGTPTIQLPLHKHTVLGGSYSPVAALISPTQTPVRYPPYDHLLMITSARSQQPPTSLHFPQTATENRKNWTQQSSPGTATFREANFSGPVSHFDDSSIRYSLSMFSSNDTQRQQSTASITSLSSSRNNRYI